MGKAQEAREERKRRKAEDAEKAARAAREAERNARLPVDVAALGPGLGWGGRDFVERGYYLDYDYTCRTCGAPATWTATRQKWWYEVAKGAVHAQPRECEPCHVRKRLAKVSAAQLGEILKLIEQPRGATVPLLLVAARCYVDLERYPKAIEMLRRARNLSTDDDERLRVSERLAAVERLLPPKAPGDVASSDDALADIAAPDDEAPDVFDDPA